MANVGTVWAYQRHNAGSVGQAHNVYVACTFFNIGDDSLDYLCTQSLTGCTDQVVSNMRSPDIFSQDFPNYVNTTSGVNVSLNWELIRWNEILLNELNNLIV